MQWERVGRVWYGTAQRIRIGGGSANVLWLQIGGPFAVICGCHMENGCEDEASHLFLWGSPLHGVGDAPRGPRMRATEKRDASVGGVALAEAESSAEFKLSAGLTSQRGAEQKGPSTANLDAALLIRCE